MLIIRWWLFRYVSSSCLLVAGMVYLTVLMIWRKVLLAMAAWAISAMSRQLVVWDSSGRPLALVKFVFVQPKAVAFSFIISMKAS